MVYKVDDMLECFVFVFMWDCVFYFGEFDFVLGCKDFVGVVLYGGG